MAKKIKTCGKASLPNTLSGDDYWESYFRNTQHGVLILDKP